MADPVNLPDLIISLSHDNVRLQLLDNANTGIDPWDANYPIEALFSEEELSQVFDTALNANPALIDQFNQVEVVVVDSPNLCLPEHYGADDTWSAIAGRYLRNRKGDKLISDAIADDSLLAYNLPLGAINLIHEYYANAGQQHLISILWSAIHDHVKDLPDTGLRLFYALKGKTLIVLGASAGKLVFTKIYFVPEKEDVHYYTIACHKLMQPVDSWLVTLEGEVNSFKLEDVPDFRFQHTLTLPDTATLVARHRS